MIFNCGPTREEKREEKKKEKEEWHLWFAWHPVRLGVNDCRWMEIVERKGDYIDYGDDGPFMKWEYRNIAH